MQQNEQAIIQLAGKQKGRSRNGWIRSCRILPEWIVKFLRLGERIETYQNQADGIGINKDKMVITSIAREANACQLVP